VAVAATGNRGRTARMKMDPELPSGFEFQDRPLPPHAGGSVEAAFAAESPLVVADLRAARTGVDDAESFQRIRMEDYFMDVPVFDAFDAIACVTCTSVSEMDGESTPIYASSVPRPVSRRRWNRH
jgi:erythromycin esterase